MLKRPCAVVITPDNSTILCGDKFGDVYSIPLLWSPDEEQNDDPAKESQEVQEPKKFVPSASTLTVHSGRNRRALEMQLKHADKWVKTKEPLKFKHDLLLGHVSMLTDVAFIATGRHPSSDNNLEKRPSRSYILTADRDEHIRVSRGPPQAHIIEGYCLGHTEFVSKLCAYDDELLLSGGGDNYIFVWNWRLCRFLKKIDLKTPLDGYVSQDAAKSQGDDLEQSDWKVAVTGIWKLRNEDSMKRVGSLLATSEK
jgi:tRNA (guanine-N(7)-)-methyltransferase subunit TRM82